MGEECEFSFFEGLDNDGANRMNYGPLPRVDFAILTVIREEFEAVLKRFPTQETFSGAREYNLTSVPRMLGGTFQVATVSCVEQGTGDAQDAARGVISELEPQWLLVVGIAGGRPSNDFTLGDVVLSTRIYDLTVESRQQDEPTEYSVAGGGLHPKVTSYIANLPARVSNIEGWNASASIQVPRPVLEVAKAQVFGDSEWRSKVMDSLQHHFVSPSGLLPTFVHGPIISSDRLVKDPEVLIGWLRFARHALAIEMESAGVYRAARRPQGECAFMAIRGISDIIGLKRDDAWKLYACNTAAAFARSFIASHDLKPLTQRALRPPRGRELSIWQGSIRTAGRSGFPGDVLTLAEEAPSELDRSKAILTAAKNLIDLGRQELACELLEALPTNIRHLEAHCELVRVYARLGQLPRAQVLIDAAKDELGAKGHADAQLHGVLGRVYKTMWRAKWENLASRDQRRRAAAQEADLAVDSLRSYYQAFRASLNSYYNGINVITVSSLIDDLFAHTGATPAGGLALDISQIASVVQFAAVISIEEGRQNAEADEHTLWAMATLGELALVLNKPDAALQRYREVAAATNITPRFLNSMRSQLVLMRSVGFRTPLVDQIIGELEKRAEVLIPELQFRRIFIGVGWSSTRDSETARASVDRWVQQSDLGCEDLLICEPGTCEQLFLAEATRARGASVWLFVPVPLHEYLRVCPSAANNVWIDLLQTVQVHGCELVFQHKRIGPAASYNIARDRNRRWMLNRARVEAPPHRLFGVLIHDSEMEHGTDATIAADLALAIKCAGGVVQTIDVGQGGV